MRGHCGRFAPTASDVSSDDGYGSNRGHDSDSGDGSNDGCIGLMQQTPFHRREAPVTLFLSCLLSMLSFGCRPRNGSGMYSLTVLSPTLL